MIDILELERAPNSGKRCCEKILWEKLIYPGVSEETHQESFAKLGQQIPSINLAAREIFSNSKRLHKIFLSE